MIEVEKLKPIDVSKFNVTENGNVIRDDNISIEKMTNEEEKAEEYAKEKISDMKVKGFTLLEIAHLSNGANIYNPKVEHLLNDKIKQAYLDGRAEGKPKWHDLRKDPQDLPIKNGSYLCRVDTIGSIISYRVCEWRNEPLVKYGRNWQGFGYIVLEWKEIE